MTAVNRRILLGALPALAALGALGACAPADDLTKPPEPLGNFKLGYTIVVVDEPKIGPFSRKATDAEWKAELEQAIDRRFSRFAGDTPYHIAVKLELYALALPGVPVVAHPRSVLAISANVWATYGKLNPEPEPLTIWEGVSDKTIIGSGLTRTREEQMRVLADNAAREIETWMRTHPEWFTGSFPAVPGTEPKEEDEDGASEG